MTAAVAVLDIVLAVGVLLAAALALFLPRRSTSVVLFLVFGLLLAIVWARLGAPDVALAEAVLGAGVTGALLLDAVTRPRGARDSAVGAGSGPFGRLKAAQARPAFVIAGAALGLAIAVVLAVVLLGIGEPRIDLAGSVAERMPESGVEHPVTAVLLNFRSYDTLLEIAVLAVAALGALALSSGERSAAETGAARAAAVPPVLDQLVRLLAPVLVLLIGWLLVAGTTRPGGAFQAGAVLAAALILGYLVRSGAELRRARWTRPVLLIGLAAFLLAAAITGMLGSGWLVFDTAWAGTVILAIELALTVGIGAALAAIFVANRGGLR